jgi:hypothetical protein
MLTLLKIIFHHSSFFLCSPINGKCASPHRNAIPLHASVYRSEIGGIPIRLKVVRQLPRNNIARSAPLESAIAPSATSAANKGFTGGGSVVSYFNDKETIMKLAAIALASGFAILNTCAFAQTVRDKSNVPNHPMYRGTDPSADSHAKYGNLYGNFSGAGNTDVWGHFGAYYGPMIPAGAGGR